MNRSLQAQLGARIALVSLICLTLMVMLLSFLMHQHVHRQTDALLLQLAHAEVNNMVEEGTDLHVHNMSIHLPSLVSSLTTRYALVFDEAGRIVDHTAGFEPGTQVPNRWIREDGRPAYFNTGDMFDKPLRLVVQPMDFKGNRAYLGLGVAHRDLDASLWAFVAIAVPGALLAAMMITAAGVWLIRRRLVDLSRLSEACRGLELFSGKISGDDHRRRLTVPDTAAEEFRLLAHTLRDLIDRVQGLLETQNRFIAEAAHELRTPLTSLRGDLELALRRERDAADYRDFITTALEDVDRLQSLAMDLLEGARGREGDLALEDENLAELVDEACRQRKRTLDQAGFTVVLDMPAKVAVRTNRRACIRILENLLENAVRHSGGTRVNISAEVVRDKVLLWMVDDGVGIRADLVEGLFHPFQRGSQKGFGLGLYIAHQLMCAQNGSLELIRKSGEEKGTCWKLTFPRSTDRL